MVGSGVLLDIVQNLQRCRHGGRRCLTRRVRGGDWQQTVCKHAAEVCKICMYSVLWRQVCTSVSVYKQHISYAPWHTCCNTAACVHVHTVCATAGCCCCLLLLQVVVQKSGGSLLWEPGENRVVEVPAGVPPDALLSADCAWGHPELMEALQVSVCN